MRDLYLDLRHPLLEVEWERAKLLLTEFLRLWVCPAQYTIYVVGIVRNNMYFSYEIINHDRISLSQDTAHTSGIYSYCTVRTTLYIYMSYEYESATRHAASTKLPCNRPYCSSDCTVHTLDTAALLQLSVCTPSVPWYAVCMYVVRTVATASIRRYIQLQPVSGTVQLRAVRLCKTSYNVLRSAVRGVCQSVKRGLSVAPDSHIQEHTQESGAQDGPGPATYTGRTAPAGIKG